MYIIWTQNYFIALIIDTNQRSKLYETLELVCMLQFAVLITSACYAWVDPNVSAVEFELRDRVWEEEILSDFIQAILKQSSLFATP